VKLRWKVHPAGWILLAILLITVPAAQLLAAVLALLLHEAGHLIAMKSCGVKECAVELTPFGGVADVPSYERLSWGKRALCAAGGVVSSGLMAALCLLARLGGLFWQAFLGCNLMMALLNLLPIWPLDGARLLTAWAEKIGLEKTVAKACVFLGYLFALLLFFLGIYGVFQGIVNLSLFLLPPYLCYASYQSAVYSRIRSMDSLASGQPMGDGEIRPVKAFAACGQPRPVDVLRMQRLISAKNTPILYIFDADNGQISQTLTQKQICNNLFSDRT